MSIAHTRYHAAQQAFQEEFLYMLQKVEEYKTQQGGDAITDNAKRIYDSRRRKLQHLADFHDASETLVQHLEKWIEDLLAENRRLKNIEHENRNMKGEAHQDNHVPFREFLQMMLIINPQRMPRRIGSMLNQLEGRREATIDFARTAQPQLY